MSAPHRQPPDPPTCARCGESVIRGRHKCDNQPPVSTDPESFAVTLGSGAQREISRLLDRIGELEAERDRAWDRALRERKRQDTARLDGETAERQRILQLGHAELARLDRQYDGQAMTGALYDFLALLEPKP